MAGVPVGDTTLLAKLREARDWRADEGAYVYRYDLVGATLDALPAVVTLIEKAEALETWLENEGLWRPGEPEYNRVHLEFRAALAPFVGEATQ